MRPRFSQPPRTGEVGLALVGAAVAGCAAYVAGLGAVLTLAAGMVLSAAVLWPTALVAVAIGENWPVLAASSGGLGRQIAALTALGALAWLYRDVRRHPWRTGRPSLGYWTLLVILAITLVDTLLISRANFQYLILTGCASVPLSIVGLRWGHRPIPTTWTLLLSALSPLLLLGVVDRQHFNPITVGHVAWAGLYFCIVDRKISRPLATGLALVCFAEWAATNHLGPLLAGGSCLLVHARSVGALSADTFLGRFGSSKNKRTHSLRALRLALVPLVAGIGIWFAYGGVQAAISELNSGTFTNTSARSSTWLQIIRDAQVVGGGVEAVASNSFGRTLEIQPHNLVLDALNSAGWLGCALILVSLCVAARGALASRHPLTPYAVGVIVANMFSGGLLRSPTLWFALSFLIAEAPRRRHSFAPQTTNLVAPA